ncbi:hypothetical protein [Pseudomonas sp. RL_15y_Pfl2_60]|uniref:hypothetical protein n=1 Tax=Pseudomonas sp. RL_15y_Pfl2_60 TaxID=3088709 RepID=UPI0030DAE684
MSLNTFGPSIESGFLNHLLRGGGNLNDIFNRRVQTGVASGRAGLLVCSNASSNANSPVLPGWVSPG